MAEIADPEVETRRAAQRAATMARGADAVAWAPEELLAEPEPAPRKAPKKKASKRDRLPACLVRVGPHGPHGRHAIGATAPRPEEARTGLEAHRARGTHVPLVLHDAQRGSVPRGQ